MELVSGLVPDGNRRSALLELWQNNITWPGQDVHVHPSLVWVINTRHL